MNSKSTQVNPSIKHLKVRMLHGLVFLSEKEGWGVILRGQGIAIEETLDQALVKLEKLALDILVAEENGSCVDTLTRFRMDEDFSLRNGLDRIGGNGPWFVVVNGRHQHGTHETLGGALQFFEGAMLKEGHFEPTTCDHY